MHLLCRRQHLRPEDVGNCIWLSVSAGLASHHILSLTPGRVWRKLSHLHRSCLWKDGELVRSRVWCCLFRMGYDNISCYHRMHIWTQLRGVKTYQLQRNKNRHTCFSPLHIYPRPQKHNIAPIFLTPADLPNPATRWPVDSSLRFSFARTGTLCSIKRTK